LLAVRRSVADRHARLQPRRDGASVSDWIPEA
jgi:hypothetical protein